MISSLLQELPPLICSPLSKFFAGVAYLFHFKFFASNFVFNPPYLGFCSCLISPPPESSLVKVIVDFHLARSNINFFVLLLFQFQCIRYRCSILLKTLCLLWLNFLFSIYLIGFFPFTLLMSLLSLPFSSCWNVPQLTSQNSSLLLISSHQISWL